jgi:hypothetical protein
MTAQDGIVYPVYRLENTANHLFCSVDSNAFDALFQERVLELEAGRCISDLTRSKCDATLNYQQEQVNLYLR